LHGFKNHLLNLKEIIKDYEDDSISLIDSSQAMRLNNFDKIVSQFRNKSDAMINVGKLWKKSISLALIEPTELDLYNPKYYGIIRSAWDYAIDTNLDFVANKFDIIINKGLKTNEESQSNS
jgi:hypothetical protein